MSLETAVAEKPGATGDELSCNGTSSDGESVVGHNEMQQHRADWKLWGRNDNKSLPLNTIALCAVNGSLLKSIKIFPVTASGLSEFQMVLPPPGRDRSAESTEQQEIDRLGEFTSTIPFER
jgi:hypothetical protein